MTQQMRQELRIQGRTPGGSREARRLRSEGLVPAVLYGKKKESHVLVDELEFMRTIGHAIGSGMIDIELEGEKQTVLIKEVQWDALTDRPIHIDFMRVSMDDMVTVPVPVHLINSPVGVSIGGGVLDHHMHEVLIRVKASDIPSGIVVDVSDLDLGDSIHVSDLEIPEGAEAESNPEAVVVSVLTPTILKVAVEEEELEEALAEGEEPAEGEEAAEGEERTGEDGTGEPEEDKRAGH